MSKNKLFGFLTGVGSAVALGGFLIAPERVDEDLYAPF